MILSLQSWLKNMYADRARFGALGSFLPFDFGAFSAFVAAFRCAREGCQRPCTAYTKPPGTPQAEGGW